MLPSNWLVPLLIATTNPSSYYVLSELKAAATKWPTFEGQKISLSVIDDPTFVNHTDTELAVLLSQRQRDLFKFDDSLYTGAFLVLDDNSGAEAYVKGVVFDEQQEGAEDGWYSFGDDYSLEQVAEAEKAGTLLKGAPESNTYGIRDFVHLPVLLGMPVDNEAEARYWARLRGKWAVHADQSPESLSKDAPEPQAWYPGDSETVLKFSYSNTGTFTPKCRFKYKNSSGNTIIVPYPLAIGQQRGEKGETITEFLGVECANKPAPDLEWDGVDMKGRD